MSHSPDKPAPHELTFFAFATPLRGLHLSCATVATLIQEASRARKPLIAVLRVAIEMGAREMRKR